MVHNAQYKAAAARLAAARAMQKAAASKGTSPFVTAWGRQVAGPAAAPGAPAAPAPAGAASPNGDISTAGDVDPRDSTYGAGLAALLGQIQTQRQAVESAGQTDHQSYDENMPRIAANRATSLQNTKVTANDQGLLYSGILGKRQGDVNQQYDDQVNSETSALSGRDAARQAQLQQIGNLTADPNSPYGYSATGDAGTTFYNLLRDAADRRVTTAASAAPDMTPPTPAAPVSMTPPAAATPALNHTGPTAKLPVYTPGTPAPAGRLGGVASAWNKPKVAKPKAIHGFSSVTLTRKK